MWKKIAVTGAVGAAVLGAGGAALAASDGSLNLASAATSAGPHTKAGAQAGAGKHHGRRGPLGRLNRLAHATWVTRDHRTGGFVTHDAIHGDVTAVSATSVTVRAADGVTQTYAIGGDTRIRVRAAGGGKPATIGQVHPADHVLVIGSGTGSLSAKRVVTGLPR